MAEKNKNQLRLKPVIFLMTLLLVSFFFFFTNSSHASVTKSLNYQGFLADSDGNAVADGSYTLHLKIYATSTGGTELWSSDQSVTASSGIFSTLLDVSTLDFSGDSYYLGVAINSDSEMTPRKQLGSVPQAINSNNLIGDGYIKLTGVPTGSDIDQGTVYINPASLENGETLLGMAVAGTPKLKIVSSQDEETVGNFQRMRIGDEFQIYTYNAEGNDRAGMNLTLNDDRGRVLLYSRGEDAIFGDSVVTLTEDELHFNATFSPNGSGERTLLDLNGNYSRLDSSGDGYTGIKLNIVDAQAGADGARNLIDLQVGDESKFLVNSEGNVGIGTSVPRNKLVVEDFATGNKAGLFSTDQMLLSQLEGGSYFGRTSITENQWENSSYGEVWTPKGPSAHWYSIAMSSNGKIQTACTGTRCYVSNDYGENWNAKGAIPGGGLIVAMSSDGKIQSLVAGDTDVANRSRIFVSTDYGDNWSAVGPTLFWGAISMSSDGKIQTAVPFDDASRPGYIYVSYDYGATWNAKTETREYWNGIAMSSDGKIQTATGYFSNYGIYVSTDYGNTWSLKDNSIGNFSKVAMSADGKIQSVLGYGDNIYISTDYGESWTAKGPQLYWTGIAMSSDGKIQTATSNLAYDYNIYVSTDYGETWMPKESARNWRRVAMSSDGKVQSAVAFNGQIYVSYADSYVNGNIGIGTDSPLAKLDVNGGAPADGTGENLLLNLAADYSNLNTAGDGYVGIKLNVTDAQAGALGARNLMDLQVDDVSKFLVDSEGHITLGGVDDLANPKTCLSGHGDCNGELDDIHFFGNYTGESNGDGDQAQYSVRIASSNDPNPDTFIWSDDREITWSDPVVIAGSVQYLSHGISVQFDNLTGHNSLTWRSAVKNSLAVTDGNIKIGDLSNAGAFGILGRSPFNGGFGLSYYDDSGNVSSSVEMRDGEASLSGGGNWLGVYQHNFQLDTSSPDDGSGFNTAGRFNIDFGNLNTTGDGYTALKLNVTDAQAGADGARNLMDLQLDDASKFKVDSMGGLAISGASNYVFESNGGDPHPDAVKLTGTYDGIGGERDYTITIEAGGTTFSWDDGDNLTTGVALVTDTPIGLNHGVSITFSSSYSYLEGEEYGLRYAQHDFVMPGLTADGTWWRGRNEYGKEGGGIEFGADSTGLDLYGYDYTDAGRNYTELNIRGAGPYFSFSNHLSPIDGSGETIGTLFNYKFDDLATAGDGYTALKVNVTDTVDPDVTTKNLMDLQVGGDSQFLVTSSGNVGIGTNSPQEKLDVVGNVQNLLDSSNYQMVRKGAVHLTLGHPVFVAVSGSYAYVTTYSTPGTLTVVDISDPSAPEEMGSVTFNSGENLAYSVSVAGHYAYVVAGSSPTRVVVIDVADPSAPVEVGSVTLNTGENEGYYIAVSGKYAYIPTWTNPARMVIVDISDPTNPVRTGAVTFDSGENLGGSLAVLGDYAYVTVYYGTPKVVAIDISDPSAPVRAGEAALEANEYLGISIATSGRYAFMVTEGTPARLVALDLSNPGAPVRVSSIAMNAGEGVATAIAVAGRYAYLITGSTWPAKVIAVDISDPSNMRRIGSIDLESDENVGRYLTVSGQYAYAVTQSSRALVVIDLTGMETTSLMAHSLDAGILQVRKNATISENLNVGMGLIVGQSSLLQGDLSVGGDSVLLGSLGIGGNPVMITRPYQNNIVGTINDLSSGGTFSGSADLASTLEYHVKITDAGATDSFQWSSDAGATWNGVGIPITGAAQNLSNGVQITFAAGTGHNVDDEWTFYTKTYQMVAQGSDGWGFQVNSGDLYTKFSPVSLGFNINLTDGSTNYGTVGLDKDEVWLSSQDNNLEIFKNKAGDFTGETLGLVHLYNSTPIPDGYGTGTYFNISPDFSTMNSAGDGYTALKLNVTDAQAGALGVRNLIDLRVAPAADPNNYVSQFKVESDGTITTTLGGGDLSSVGGVITSSSDERLKNISGYYRSGLDIISGIKPIEYQWNKESGLDTEKQYIGFSAQNIQSLIPEAVDTNSKGFLTLSDRPILAATVNAIQEQQSQISLIDTATSDLTLKTDQNITTLEELQSSIDQQLFLIGENLHNLEKDSSQQESKLETLESSILTLQIQLTQLQSKANAEFNLAQIDLNTEDLTFMKLLLGTDRVTNPEDLDILGQLSSKTLSTGGIEITIIDPDAPTIGSATIKPADTDSDGKSVIVKTKAVGEKSKVFVTPVGDSPVSWIISDIQNEESFKILLDKPTEQIVRFNWWIVETK